MMPEMCRGEFFKVDKLQLFLRSVKGKKIMIGSHPNGDCNKPRVIVKNAMEK